MKFTKEALMRKLEADIKEEKRIIDTYLLGESEIGTVKDNGRLGYLMALHYCYQLIKECEEEGDENG